MLYGSVIYRPPKNEDDDDDADDEADYSTSPSPYQSGTYQVPSSMLEGLASMFGGRSKSNLRDRRSVADIVTETPTHLKAPLITTAHTSPRHKKRETATPGFLTAVVLSNPPNGGIKGYPLQVVMQVATGTGGGRSNIVTPAPWSNDLFALSDSERGLVQIWKLDGIANLPLDGPRGMIPTLPLNQAGNQRGKQGSVPNVRASIVAEWTAPPQAVGNLNEENNNDNRKRSWWSRVMGSKTKRAATGTEAAPAIPSGRGCCANAVWLD